MTNSSVQPTQPQVYASSTLAEVDDLLSRAQELQLSDAAGAFVLCEKALEEARRLDSSLGVGRSLYTRSRLFLQLSNPQSALADASAALLHFEALDDRWRTESTLNLLGLINSELGNLSAAHKYFLARYQLCAGRGGEAEAEAFLNLGYIHDYLGNHTDALSSYLKSQKLSSGRASSVDEARLLNNIGYSYYRLDQQTEALEHYRKALALSKADQNLYALLLDNIALALEKLGHYEHALEQQQQSLNLRKLLADKRGVSYSLDSLGSTYQKLGEVGKAQACLEQSLTLKEELSDQKGEAETLLLLGTLFLGQAQLGRALPLLQRALAAAAQSGSQDNLYKAHKALSETFKRSGHLAEALEHFEHYSEVKERVFNEVSNRTLSSLRVQFETEQAEQEREVYRLKNVELAHANAELQALNAKATNLLAQLERQAKEDALTGLSNRRHADLRLREEFARARRFNHALSVALCDIDDFKKINDTFSHHLGDEVLRVVARLFQDHVRKVDTVARYGGEEFLLLFPETSGAGAFTVCRELCQKVAAYPWGTLALGLSVTLSIGVSDDSSAVNHEKLVALADAKLYEAKRKGKNRVGC